LYEILIKRTTNPCKIMQLRIISRFIKQNSMSNQYRWSEERPFVVDVFDEAVGTYVSTYHTTLDEAAERTASLAGQECAYVTALGRHVLRVSLSSPPGEIRVCVLDYAMRGNGRAAENDNSLPPWLSAAGR
jgi:hypothetical protein